ncbi:hypothetical protein BJV77DRAFT_68161 [Russula vinacea]|nr:hypothetical protein BJV77DRAFT_68161 [Russula vinacea]
MLMSQADLDELHERLIPLVVPPRNANGSVSKRKMKEVTVKVTIKVTMQTHREATGRRNVTKAENGLIRLLIQLLSSTKKRSLCVRLSGATGSVKHTPSETGLCHAGGMVTRLSATLSQKMTSTYGQNYNSKTRPQYLSIKSPRKSIFITLLATHGVHKTGTKRQQ